MNGDDPKILELPKAGIAPEERARRLKVEVERLAGLPAVERLFYIESDDVAEKHGVSRAVLKEMVEATIRANEKKAREDKAEDRQRIRRVEKNKVTAQRELAREQAKQKREQDQADKEAERKRKERKKAFEAIGKLPVLAHEARLAEHSKRSGEDLDFLRDEFAAYYVPADIDTKPIEPWDQPVDTHTLLIELMAQLRRYVVVQDDVASVFMGP